MFEVLEFVFDNYRSPNQCPTLPVLHRMLISLGFRADGVLNALVWLEDLQHLAPFPPQPKTISDTHDCAVSSELPASNRVLTAPELRKLGTDGWGLLTSLASSGSLPWNRLELVIDRAMATPTQTLELDQLKLIVLMVFWSLNEADESALTDTLLDGFAVHTVH